MTQIKNRDIVCFSHDWTGDPLSKTHFMRLLSENNRVLWVNSIGYRAPSVSASDMGRAWRKVKAAWEPVREVEPNIFVLNPLAIPAHGSKLARKINRVWLGWQVRRAMKRLRFMSPINWVFNPVAGSLAGTLGEKRIIYHCVDEYTAFAGVPSASIAAIEQDLLKKADAIFVSAEKLRQTKTSANVPTWLVRHGVDFDHFQKALSPSTVVPSEIVNLPKPIIGYFGLIAEDWVDVPLLEQVAKHFSSGSLVLLGKSTMDLSELSKLPNVHLLGRKPYADLPAFCKGFDASIIPFPISEVTLNANPLKAREYLAAGLPVVSTNIPEVVVMGNCRVGNDPPTFIAELEKALAKPGPQASISEQVRNESWRARLGEIEEHLSTAFASQF